MNQGNAHRGQRTGGNRLIRRTALACLLALAPCFTPAQTPGPHGIFRPAVTGQFDELHRPAYIPAAQARLQDKDPVCGLVVGNTVRCYPLRQLWYHHVVNDTFGGQRLALTYCIMAHTATTVVMGETSAGLKVGGIEAGTLVLGDCGTTTALWPQIRPDLAAAGQTTGPVLLLGPQPVLTTWGQWRKAHPNTEVLAPVEKYEFQYSLYDGRPKGFRAPIVESTVSRLDPRLEPDVEVFGIHHGEDSVALPLKSLSSASETSVTVGGTPVRIGWNATLAHPEILSPPGLFGTRARWFSWSSYYPQTRLLP